MDEDLVGLHDGQLLRISSAPSLKTVSRPGSPPGARTSAFNVAAPGARAAGAPGGRAAWRPVPRAGEHGARRPPFPLPRRGGGECHPATRRGPVGLWRVRLEWGDRPPNQIEAEIGSEDRREFD